MAPEDITGRGRLKSGIREEAPGTSAANWKKLRPLIANSVTCLPEITVLISFDSVWTRTAVSETVTL